MSIEGISLNMNDVVDIFDKEEEEIVYNFPEYLHLLENLPNILFQKCSLLHTVSTIFLLLS